MSKAPTCYFSYCWENDYATIERIKDKVVKQSNRRIEVILDRQDFHIAKDIDQCEKQILDSDSIVIFFSPEYKKVISEAHVSRGVHREYKYIMEKAIKSPGCVIPVLYSGKREEAITLEFIGSIASDITNLQFGKDKRGRTSIVQGKEALGNLVDSIIAITVNMMRIREPKFDGTSDKIQKLLHENQSVGNLPKECIVDLKVYDDLFNQRNSFVMGRKGSGKTTILEIMERRNPQLFAERYKSLYPIHADSIEMETAFALLQTNQSDRAYFEISSVLEVYWSTCLLLYGIYVVSLEAYYGRITDKRKKLFHEAGKAIMKLTNIRELDDYSIRKSLLNLCAEHIHNYMNGESLNYVDDASAYTVTQMKSCFSPYNILCGLLGEALLEKLSTAIASCKKKIIIALDGFDTHSEDFRRTTNYNLRNEATRNIGEQRKEFECMFYRSLVSIIRALRTRPSDSSTIGRIFGMFDYYIVLPRDRYDQIKSVDRDIAKYSFINLQWDAIELVTLANLRLEFIYDIKPNGDLLPKDRFHYLIKKIFPKVPCEISIEIMNQAFKVDLFQYILSMSFWNPRDILAHLAALEAACGQNKKEGNIAPDNETIIRIIRNTAEKIIEKELYKEFSEVFLNIREVLDQFKGKTLSLTIEQFCDIITHTTFKTNYEYECTHLDQKIRLLYELGVIGCQFTNNEGKSKSHQANICFVFNEGMKPINKVISDLHDATKYCHFVFNPILLDHLSLHDNVLTVIGNYGWEYLEQNHLTKELIHGI